MGESSGHIARQAGDLHIVGMVAAASWRHNLGSDWRGSLQPVLSCDVIRDAMDGRWTMDEGIMRDTHRRHPCEKDGKKTDWTAKGRVTPVIPGHSSHRQSLEKLRLNRAASL